MTEIVRAGILSIDPGQMEAAKSLGMTYGKAMRRIVLPQAARVIVPPLGNEFNNMLKTTSLLVIICVPELYVDFSRKNGSGPTSSIPSSCSSRRHLVPPPDHDLGPDPGLDRAAAGARHAASARAGPSMRARLFGFRSDRRRSEPRPHDLRRDRSRPARRHRRRPDGDDVVVEATDVHKSFGRLHVLQGVSLTVQRREVVVHHRSVRLGQDDLPALHQPPREDPGRAGSWSTASSIGYRERERQAGRGPRAEHRARSAREIGMVFQRFNLFPHMTALENVIEAPIQVRGLAEDEAREMGVEPCSSGSAWRHKVDAYPGAALRRPAAARRHRAGAGHAARADALRRADQRARPGDDRRGARVMKELAREGMTMIVVSHEMGFAREVGRPGGDDGRGRDHRGGHAGATSSPTRRRSGRRRSSRRSSKAWRRTRRGAPLPESRQVTTVRARRRPCCQIHTGCPSGTSTATDSRQACSWRIRRRTRRLAVTGRESGGKPRLGR